MRRSLLSGLVAVTAIAVSAMGVRADVSTSVTPTCLDNPCTQVMFSLEVATPAPSGDWWLSTFSMWTAGGSWSFDTSYTPTNSVGAVSGFVGDDYSLGRVTRLTNIGNSLTFTLAFTSPTGAPVGNWGDLGYGGVLKYRGADGWVPGEIGGFAGAGQDPVGDEIQPVIEPLIVVDEPLPGPGEGTVTPEPATILLLGTGLIGIAGVARRRKNLQQDGEEEP